MRLDPTASSEIAQVYEEVAPQLRRVLGMNLRAPGWVLDDACQMAWETLLVHPERVDRSRLLGWLATTARREALTLLRRSQLELCVDAAGPADEMLGAAPDPAQAAEFWERMGEIRRLSRRQQRIVWMQSLGYQYDEIAAETGESLRSVQRQLISARRRLRTAA